MATQGFVMAMKNAFKLDSESTIDFAKQLKTLSNEDRTAFHRILIEGGVVCDPPLPLA